MTVDRVSVKPKLVIIKTRSLVSQSPVIYGIKRVKVIIIVMVTIRAWRHETTQQF